MMYSIYALVDNDGVVKYVGQTTQVDVRKRDHKNQKPPHNFVIMKENLQQKKRSSLRLIVLPNTIHSRMVGI